MLKLLPPPGLQPWCGRGAVLSCLPGFLTLPLAFNFQGSSYGFLSHRKEVGFLSSPGHVTYEVLALFLAACFWALWRSPHSLGVSHLQFLNETNVSSSKLLAVVVHPIQSLNINFYSFFMCLF